MVTIFGESAGGSSVDMHVVSKGSHGLFDQAITEVRLMCSSHVIESHSMIPTALHGALSQFRVRSSDTNAPMDRIFSKTMQGEYTWEKQLEKNYLDFNLDITMSNICQIFVCKSVMD